MKCTYVPDFNWREKTDRYRKEKFERNNTAKPIIILDRPSENNIPIDLQAALAISAQKKP